MEKLSFPIERTPAMRILGEFYTGRLMGRIVVVTLIIIAIMFLIKLNFAPISVIFVIFFLAPMIMILNVRMIVKGHQLMNPWCDLEFEKDILRYKTGFPNTMNPNWKEIKITRENRDIEIRGSADTGYSLKLMGDHHPEIKFGLWLDLDEARRGASELSEWLNGKIIENLKDSPEVQHS